MELSTALIIIGSLAASGMFVSVGIVVIKENVIVEKKIGKEAYKDIVNGKI